MESAFTWAPMVVSAIGGFMRGGPEGSDVFGFPSESRGFKRATPGGDDPLAMQLMLEGVENLRRLGAKTAQYSTKPVVLPSAVVQPLPMYKGGGAYVDVGSTTQDVANRFPEVLYRGGVQWGTPKQGTAEKWPVPFHFRAGQTVHEQGEPPTLFPQQYPQFGAGFAGLQQMTDALALAGISPEQQAAREGGTQKYPGMQFSGARRNLPYYHPGLRVTPDPTNA
jgi:hypothetical protein